MSQYPLGTFETGFFGVQPIIDLPVVSAKMYTGEWKREYYPPAKGRPGFYAYFENKEFGQIQGVTLLTQIPGPTIGEPTIPPVAPAPESKPGSSVGVIALFGGAALIAFLLS